MRHKSIPSYESAIYFDLDKDIIKPNCDFKFYYKMTNITLTILDRGNKIIYQTGQMINILFVLSIMIYQLKF